MAQEGINRTLKEYNIKHYHIKMDISEVGNQGGDEWSSSEYGSMTGLCGWSNQMSITFTRKELMPCLINYFTLYVETMYHAQG